MTKSNGVKDVSSEKIYCSLDIETSGFDPLKDEILEVGWVKFQTSNSKLQILEEWTKVFKPTKPVEAKILGLTGIKQKELDEGDDFALHKDFIQEQLKDVVIVGHNVIFDIKFLESRGIKFSGDVVDTLDLVQWILPTHHSYNLENLMHYFGISHANAHRALADAKATLEVLKKLISVFESFPSKLRGKILEIISPHNFLWYKLLPTEIGEKKTGGVKKVLKTKAVFKEKTDLKFENHSIYNFPLGTDIKAVVLPALLKQRKKSLLVLPKKQEVINLWKEKGVEAIWDGEQLFDEKKFESFLKKVLSPEECKFALKVLVWQETNWQNTALFDLNLSFFGGQFKQVISGNTSGYNDQAKVLACDIFTFLKGSEKNIIEGRQIVLVGLAEFESAISLNASDKVSWGSVNYLLKSVYNPEVQSGEFKYKDLVEQGLNASDLFFGLVSALLQTDPPSFVDMAVTEEFKEGEKYKKIHSAAENFATKLEEINKILKIEPLSRIINNTRDFFNEIPNRVKWLELSQNRCSLNNSPLLIKDQAKKIFDSFASLLFVDSEAPKEATKFFMDRLGVEGWKLNKTKYKKGLIKDLFSGFKKIECHIEPSAVSNNQLYEIVNSKNLPAAVIFGMPKGLRDFYDEFYVQLKSYATLLSQTGGGNNKLFNNFGINNNGLLLMTDRTLLKTLSGASENSRPAKLPVQTLVILRLPFDPVSHPYAQALAATYPNAFEAMALPKALYNFHQIVSFFNTPKLKNVYLFDQKLSKNYSKAFFDYLGLLKAN